MGTPSPKPPAKDEPKNAEPVRCTYPRCRCVVSTSTSEPEPACPKGLPR
jgi:hypothetical protein